MEGVLMSKGLLSGRLMSKAVVIGRLLALAVVIAAAVSNSARAATSSVDTSICNTNPLLSQPFLFAGDQNYYTLVPGQTPDNFGDSGWTLTRGAKLVTTTLDDGATGSVLDLPSGSKAVSPTICVTAAYPTARMMVRDLVGSEGVFFYVSYAGTSTWNTPKNTGQVHGTGTAWTLSGSVNLQPYSVTGWQPVRFTLIPGGNSSNFEVYNFYVDPRMKW
jgi:hypothetical protein